MPTALPRTTPASLNVDPGAIADFIRACPELGSELHSIMVLRHGQVIAEGWANPYRAEHRQLVYSLSKSFASGAVGLAVAEGAFDYDTRLVDIFPDQVDERVGPKARSIRIRDVLSMASGHTEDMISLVKWDRSALSRDILGAFLRAEPEATVGQTFCYNQPCTWSAARAVHERLGVDIHDLLRERVFGPLGIGSTTWATDADGCSLGFSGLHITTEDLAKYFQLILDGGMYEGVPILPEEWVAGHRGPHLSPGPGQGEDDWNCGYGWQFWEGRHGYRGDGAYGQYGLILPEQDMVVIITSQTPDMQKLLDAAWSLLLPGVDRVGVGRVGDQEGQRQLDEAVADLRLEPTVGEPGGDWRGHDENGGRLELLADAQGWACTWEDGSGTTHQFQVGHGAWVETRLAHEGKSLQVAACSARTERGHTIELVWLNTPHRSTLTLPAGSDEAAHTWASQPLGHTLPWRLAQDFD